MARVIAFYAERYGVEPPEFQINSAPGLPSVTLATFTGEPPNRKVFASLNVGSDLIGTFLGSTLTHEYTHVLQHHLARWIYPPAWMAEGAATYADGLYGVLVQSGSGEVIRGNWADAAARVLTPLHELEERESFYGADEGYFLGALAVDWLVGYASRHPADDMGATAPKPMPLAEQAGNDSYIEYYRLLPLSASWQEAFTAAFGISPDTFYERFEVYRDESVLMRLFPGASLEDFYDDIKTYRTAASTPLAHLTDDAIRPVVVFTGDVPAHTRTAIQAEVDGVHTFLTERLGGEPFDYSVYIAADEESARPAFYGLYRQGLAGAPYDCSWRGRRLTFHVLTCGYELLPRVYIGGYFQALLFDRFHEPPPEWLNLGGEYYARTAYHASIDLEAYDDELRTQARIVQQSPTTLQQTENHEGTRAAGTAATWALSFVAVDWLTQYAGELSLLEYFRLLPRGQPASRIHEPGAGSWQAAFQQAFGLTIDDFYERFAAYRAALT